MTIFELILPAMEFTAEMHLRRGRRNAEMLLLEIADYSVGGVRVG